jgi:hypothetical protein
MCERKTFAEDLSAIRFFNLLGVVARFWKIRRKSQRNQTIAIPILLVSLQARLQLL